MQKPENSRMFILCLVLILLYLISSIHSQISIQGPADTDEDGIVSDYELLDYIDLWVLGNITDYELLDAIDEWAYPVTTTTTTSTTSTTSTTTTLPKLAVDYSPSSPCLEPLTLYVRPYGSTTELVEESYVNIRGPSEGGYTSYEATNGTYIISSAQEGVYATYAAKDGWIDSDVVYIPVCPVTTTTSTSTTTTTLQKLSVTYTPEYPTGATPIILYVRPYGSTTELVEDSYVNLRSPGEAGYTSYAALNGTYTVQAECGTYAAYATKENWIDSDTVYITACACCTTTSTSTTI